MNVTHQIDNQVAPVRKEIVNAILTDAKSKGQGNLRRSRSRFNKGLINSLRHQISSIESTWKEDE